MTKIDYRNQFQTGANVYDKVVQSKHIRLIYSLEKAVLSHYFATINSQTKNLLDFACGTGRWTQWLENHFKETTGVDISADMLNIAQQKCSKTQFVCADITDDTTQNGLVGQQYDVITAFRFYKNAEDQLRQEVTQALSRYMKPEGYFIFDIHLNTYSFMGVLAQVLRILRLSKRWGLSELVTRTMSMGDIRHLFAQSEFEIVDFYGMGVLPGRSNYTLLPQKWLYRLESFFTHKKLFRGISYNILVVARKRKD